MQIEYTLNLNIFQEPTYWLHEIVDEYAGVNTDDIVIYEPKATFSDLLTSLEPHIYKALSSDLGVNASDIILEFGQGDAEQLTLVVTITDDAYHGDPEANDYKAFCGISTETVIGSAREELQYIAREHFSSALTEEEFVGFFEEIVPQVRSSYRVSGIDIEAIEIVD